MIVFAFTSLKIGCDDIVRLDTACRLDGQACEADGEEEAETDGERLLPGAPIGGDVTTQAGQGEDDRHGREEDDEEDEDVCWLVHCTLRNDD